MTTTVVKELLVKYNGDAKGVNEASKTAKAAINKVNKTAKELTRRFEGVLTPQEAFRHNMSKIERVSQSAAFKMSAFNLGLTETELKARLAAREVAKLKTTSSGLLTALRPFITIFAALETVKVADDFALLESRVENSTKSVEEATKSWEGLKNISKATGADMKATVSVFQRLSFVREEINATVDEMLTFTSTVSKLGIVSGASTGALQAGLTQLGQSLSSSIVRAEEFNSIMENIPAVGVAIAEQFGVTTGELRQLVIEGKVLSEDVFAAIIAQSAKANAQFEAFPKTVGRAYANIKIRLAEAIGGINKATNATKVLIGIMEIAGKAIGAVAKLISGFSNVFKAMFDVLVAGILRTVNSAIKPIQDVINLVIEGINRIKKDKIEPIDISLGVDGDDILREGGESAAENLRKAGEDFKGAFEGALSIFTGDAGGAIKGKVDEHARSVEGLMEKYRKLSDGIKDTDSAAKTAQKEAEKLKKKQQEAADKMAESFIRIKDGFKGAGTFADKFKKTMLNVIDDIANNMIRLSFGGKSQGGLGGGIAEAIFGSLGKGISGGISSGLGGIGKFAKSLFGFRDGGDFTVGGDGASDSGIVAFKATRGEQVSVRKPNQSSGGGSSINIVQNMNIGAGVQGAVRAEIMQMMPDLRKSTVKAVEDARMRGVIA